MMTETDSAETPDQTDQATEPSIEPVKSALNELDKWERFAVKRLGKATYRAFEVHDVPDEIAFEVSAGLLTATNHDEAKDVFEQARNLLTETVQQ
jgi:hypothetical protein